MADAPDSKSGAFTGVWVQVPSPVPFGCFCFVRRGAGVADRARLESVYTSKGYRGFESLPLRHFPVSTFCATSAQAGGYWICNTGSDFDPCERKIFAAGATALKSCGRIGRNGASGSATNENDPFWGGCSGFGQAERAAEPPRGPRIESPAPPSEPPTALRPACGAPLPDP